MNKYLITVFYRTNSGCNSKLLTLQADNPDEAMQRANDKVQRQRGVIRIDTIDCIEAAQ
jgi:hypothetical protein